MKVMLRRTLLIALLALTLLGLLAIGVGAAAMTESFADDAAAIAGGAVAKITDGETTAYYAKVGDALEAVDDGQTITLLDAEGMAEKSTEIDFDRAISFKITGSAPDYAFPIVTFTNATVTFENAEIMTAELDARENGTINFVNSTMSDDCSGNSIVKSYYNGAINISGNSVVHTMQLTTMGYITISDTAQVNATWQVNVYGNGMVTIEDDAVLATGGLNVTGQDYSGRDNTDADRVGKPATVVVDGGTLKAGDVKSSSGADYSYNADGYGINFGTIAGKAALLDLKNGATVTLRLKNTGVANLGADGVINVADSTLIMTCRDSGGTAKLNNASTIYVTGTSTLSGTYTGSGWVYMNGVALDENTVLDGAKVAFIAGTNTVSGSVIDNGFFSVGVGQDSAAALAADFATANGITLGDVTVTVSDDARIGSDGSTYSGWVGSAYSADKTAYTYVLNIKNSQASFGYLHVSMDGTVNVTGAASADNKYKYEGSVVDFYAGDFIINGTVTFDSCDAWGRYTKIAADNNSDTISTLNIVNGASYEASIHNGGNASAALKFWNKNGVVNVDGGTLDVTGATTLYAKNALNVLGGATLLHDGKLNNGGVITVANGKLSIPTFTGNTIVTAEGGATLTDTYINGSLVMQGDITVVTGLKLTGDIIVDKGGVLSGDAVTFVDNSTDAFTLTEGATLALNCAVTTTDALLAGWNGHVVTTNQTAIRDNLNAVGYAMAEKTAGVWTVGITVAKIGDTNYQSLADALAAAQDGDTIVLISNVTVPSTLAVTANVTIDGANFTITSDAATAMFKLNASLVINNASIINNVETAPVFLMGDDVDLIVGSNAAINSARILDGYDMATHTHEVTVGSIALAAALEAEGYYMHNNDDGTYTISEHAVAKIGNTLYDSLADALAAAHAGDTIIILQEIELADTLVIDKSLTFSGNFNLITSHADNVFELAAGVTLTINCKVEADAAGAKLLKDFADQTVKTNNADVRDMLNAEGYAMVEESTGVWTVKVAKAMIGTINYASLADALAASVSGDEIVLLADAELTSIVIVPVGKTLTINGGAFTITSTASTAFIVEGNLTVNGALVNSYATGSAFTMSNGATLAINGAVTATKVMNAYNKDQHTVTTTVQAVAEKLNAEGYALVKSGDVWTVMTDAPEASVDGWNYVTVEDAIAVGGTVTLLRDVTVEATVEVVGNLTFTGNYTLTSTAASAFKITSGTLAINCKLVAADVLDAAGAYTATTNVKAIAEQLNAEGYALLLSEGVYTVTSNNPEVAVDGWNVATLKYALDNATHGQTVVLLRDITAAENEMNILKNITLDGNGKTLTNTTSGGKSSLRVKDAIATIKNLNLVAKTSGADGFTVAHNGGTVAEVTLIDCTISSARHGVYLYYTQADVVVTLENTTVISGRDGASAGSAIYANNGKGIVYVKNGTTLDAQGVEASYGVQLNTKSTATVILESGSVTKSKGCALYFNGTGASGTIKVAGTAIVENSYAAYATGDVTAHTLDFSESTRYQALLMTERSGNKYSYNLYEDLATALSATPKYSDGPITVTLIQNVTNFAGVTVAFPCTIDGNGYSVTVAEGKTAFTLGADCTALALNDIAINGNILAGFTAGKTVTTNMKGIADALNAQGYALYAGEGIWTVAGLGVASLNGWNYATIQEALAAAKSGESLNVLIDFSTNSTIVIDKIITIYGNNKKITSTANPAIQVSNTFTANDLKLYATGVGIKTSNGEVDPIVITLNGCTIGDATSPIGSHGIQFQYLDVDVTLFMTNSTVYATGRAVHSDMNPDRIVNITIKMDTLDTANPTLCSTGNNGLTFHFANDVNVTLVNVYIKAKDVAFGASQHNQNNAANPKVVVANATNCKFESTNSQAVAMNIDRGNVNCRFIADITLTNCVVNAVTYGVVLDGSTTDVGASKLTVSGGSITVTNGSGIHLRGDLVASVSGTTVSAAAGWAIYTEQTGDTANTVPYINLTLTNATLSGLGGVRFSSNKDATRGNSKLTISGSSITATGAHNAAYTGTNDKNNYDDKPTYVGILVSGAADVTLNDSTIAAPSTAGINFWQGCSSANLTLNNSAIGTVANPVGRMGIYVYQCSASDVYITLNNSTVAAKNIAIKVNGKAEQTAHFTIANDALDSDNPTLYSKDTFGISVNWAADMELNLTNVYINAKDSGIHATQHKTNLDGKNPKYISGTLTGCLIESGNVAINAHTSTAADQMYGMKLTIIDSTLKGTNSAIAYAGLADLTGSFITLKGNTRLESKHTILLCGVGGMITVNSVKVGDKAPVIVGSTNAIYIDSTLGVTFTADGGSITATDGAAIYRKSDGTADITTIVTLSNVSLSSEKDWAIDLMQQAFTTDTHKVDVTLTNCTVTGAYGVRVAGYELGTADNKSGYALQITGGSISTTNDVLAVEGIYALVKDATLTSAGTGSSNRAVYMQSNTGNAPKLVLDNTTLTYKRTDGLAIYLANNGSNTVILQNNSKIESSCNGIWSGDTMYGNTITLTNSSIKAAGDALHFGNVMKTVINVTLTNSTVEAGGTYALYFNGESATKGTLNLTLNGATIKTTAENGYAIFLREGMLNLTSPENSAANQILAESTGSSAIYLDVYFSESDITLHNTTVKAGNYGLYAIIVDRESSYTLAQDVNLTLVNSSMTAGGLYAIYYNSISATVGKLTIHMDGATIKTTAVVADDVAAAGVSSSVVPAAIYMREGMLTITSPENSRKNVISAEGNRGIAILFDQWAGEANITLYNAEIKAHSYAISVGSDKVDKDSDAAAVNVCVFAKNATLSIHNSTITSATAKGIYTYTASGSVLNYTFNGTTITAVDDALYFKGTATLTMNMTGSAVVTTGTGATGNAHSRGIYIEEYVLGTTTLTDTTVRANQAAIELCNYGSNHSSVIIKMTDKNVAARTGANADIYSANYRAINFRSGSAYTLELENVSVWAKLQIVHRTRPDSGNSETVKPPVNKMIGTFTNCNLVSAHATDYALWFGAQDPNAFGKNDKNEWVTTSWVVELEFTDCTITVAGYGLTVTSRPDVESIVKMTNVTIDAQKMALQGAGKLKLELNNVDIDGFLDGSQSGDPAVRLHFGETYLDLDFTDVTIRHHGTGKADSDKAMGSAAFYISNGIYDLKAHNFKVYAEGSKLHAMNLLGKGTCNVEITGDSVFHGSYTGIIYSPAGGGTFKMHLNGDARTKTTPDIKAGESHGFWMRAHGSPALTDVFTLDFKNVYVQSKGNGIHRSNDACTLTGTIDQCKFVSGTGTGLYFTNNGKDAKVWMKDITIKNTDVTGETHGFITSSCKSANGTNGSFTFINCNIHGNKNYGMYYSGFFNLTIEGSTITVGKPNVWVYDSAAFRIGDANAVVNATIRDSRFEHLGAGKLGWWDDPDNTGKHISSIASSTLNQNSNPAVNPADYGKTPNNKGEWSAQVGSGAYAIYVSNGVVTLNIYDSEIIANDDYGVGINRSGNKLNYTLYAEGTEIRAGYAGLNWGENNTGYFNVTLKSSSVTVQNGCAIRINGTNGNTEATFNIIDTTVITNGKTVGDNSATALYNEGYTVAAIWFADGQFTLNVSGNSVIKTTDAASSYAVRMAAGSRKLTFTMTGGEIIAAKGAAVQLDNGLEAEVRISGGTITSTQAEAFYLNSHGYFEFYMTGGRLVGATRGLRAYPSMDAAKTNKVYITLPALNANTPDIVTTASGGVAIYFHNAANIDLKLENVHLRGVESCIFKTDPNDAARGDRIMTITATNCKMETVGYNAETNTGYTVISVADGSASKSYMISKITLTDCELINSAQRPDGSMHAFRIDAAEGSYLNIYGGSITVPHTAFRFREWANVTIDVSPITGNGTVITAGSYLFDTANNDTYAFPSGVTELNYTQRIYVKGATMTSNSLGYNVWHSANRNIALLEITLIDTDLTTKGNSFQIGYDQSFKGDMVFYIENTNITCGNNTFRLIKEDKTLNGDLTMTIKGSTITSENNVIFLCQLKGNGTLTMTDSTIVAKNQEGIRWYSPATGVTQTLTLHNTSISAGTTAINPDCHDLLVLRITSDQPYGKQPSIVSTGLGGKDMHAIHFQSGGDVEFYIENVYMSAADTGIYRSSNEANFVGTVLNSKIEGDNISMRICYDNTNLRTVTWYSANSEYVGNTRLANKTVCSYTFEGCTFYNDDGHTLYIATKGEVNLKDCTINSKTGHSIFVDNCNNTNTDCVINVENCTMYSGNNTIYVDPDTTVQMTLINVTAISEGASAVYMYGTDESTLTIVGGYYASTGVTANGFTIDLRDSLVANIYSGYFCTNNQGVLRARDSVELNVYGGYYEMTPNTIHSQYTGVIRLGTDAGGGQATVNVYGGTFVAPEDLYSVFNLNRGRGINLYAFNAIGGQHLYTTKNATKVEMEYPTDVHEYFTNTPVMVDGAQVKLVLTEDNAGGIRFVSNIDAATIDYAKWLADDGNVSFGTVIAPLDYVQMLPAFTVELLNAAELPYLDIVAKDGLIKNADGSVTLRAVISEIKEHNYDRVFAAIAYAKVSVDGQDVYLYSAFDEEDNARSLEQLAERALADVIAFQTSAYRFAVGDGTYSRYTDEQRAALSRIVKCDYQEEIIIAPTETTPGLKKVWCDECGTYYEVLIPAGTPVAVSNDD